jgi:hypothetical protein
MRQMKFPIERWGKAIIKSYECIFYFVGSKRVSYTA